MSPSRKRAAVCLGAGLAIGVLGSAAIANAGVDMSVGIRYVASGTLDQCSAKAKAALNAYLQNATEKTPGSGAWQAYAPPNKSGQTTAGAIVRCSTVGQTYVVTFTCAVESPGNAFGADDLCRDIAHNFSGKAVQTLATPTPVPTGCAATNLVGTWVSDNDAKSCSRWTPTGISPIKTVFPATGILLVRR